REGRRLVATELRQPRLAPALGVHPGEDLAARGRQPGGDAVPRLPPPLEHLQAEAGRVYPSRELGVQAGDLPQRLVIVPRMDESEGVSREGGHPCGYGAVVPP